MSVTAGVSVDKRITIWQAQLGSWFWWPTVHNQHYLDIWIYNHPNSFFCPGGAMAEEMRLRALVVGDSFVNRLRDFIRKQNKCPDFGLKAVTVSLKGIGGAAVPKLEQWPPSWVEECQPHLTIFLVGGNDLEQPQLQVWDVADRLERLVDHHVATYGIMGAGVCCILDRSHFPQVVPSYPSRVRVYNKYIKVVFKNKARVRYWRHACIVAVEGLLIRDGVHLSRNLASARAQLSKLEPQRVLPPNCGQIMKKTTPVHLSQLPDNPPNFSFAQHFLFQ